MSIRITTVFRLLALSGLLVSPLACAQIYKIVGPDGKVTYTDRQPESVARAAAANADPKPAGQLAAAYTKQIIVESAARFCLREVPSTAVAITAAREIWRDRNGAINEKRNRIMLATMSSEERNKLAGSLQRENDAYLNKMRAAPLAEKTKWCENAPETFKSEELDISRNAALVKTIMDFQVPNRD
jgi:hypothetical protein